MEADWVRIQQYVLFTIALACSLLTLLALRFLTFFKNLLIRILERRWCNSRLVNRNFVISNLEEDFSDGTVLCYLLEELSGEQLPTNVINAPTSKDEKMTNLTNCFNFIKAQNIMLFNIYPEGTLLRLTNVIEKLKNAVSAIDVLEKNTNLILGLIWSLILHYLIAKPMYGKNPKKALLEWCNKLLNPQGIFVNDFTTSWQDGTALCGLVNALRNDEIDLYKLYHESDKRKNIDLAFDKAEELFQISSYT